MHTIVDNIIEMLNDDIVSHGWVVQCIKKTEHISMPRQQQVENVLKELLLTGKVEIGATNLTMSNYLEFIGWRGDVDKRVARAVEAVDTSSGHDKEFVYWLCLRENADRFEEEELSGG